MRNEQRANEEHGLAYGLKGDFDRAIMDWEAVLRINPNHALVRPFLERAKQMRGY